MNIKKSIFILSIVALAAFSGCKKAETEPEIGTNVNYEKLKGYPKWVIQPRYENGIAGVGSAKMTDLGFDFARKEAMASAREDLASQITIKVNNLYKSYRSRIGLGEATSVDSSAENITKQVVNLDLQGASLVDTWISPEDELYVLLGVDNENIAKSATAAISNPNNYGSQEEKTKIKAADSQKELEAEVNEYFSPSTPTTNN
ncbi:MAG: LPP20 family lipoprotein [Psychrilyobacter sp.]|nr:LPP20 family lipoprotein [Psychrilyobacter sp.]